MISLEQAKKILLDNGEPFTDEEMAKIYDALKSSAKLIVSLSKLEEHDE